MENTPASVILSLVKEGCVVRCPTTRVPDVGLPRLSITLPGEEIALALFRRRKRPGRGIPESAIDRAVLDHLEEFIRTRRGVEAFIEPQTVMTETTVILIADDGEWTRRRIGGPDAARRFAHRMAIPIYDVRLVGYPQRMRDYNERRRRRPNQF